MSGQGEIKFWRWKCAGCGNETVMPLAGKLPQICSATYGCFGTEFLKVGEGRTEDEAKKVLTASAMLGGRSLKK